MNFSFRKKKKEDNNISIVFDIRSASVGAAIISKNKEGLSIIKYTVRENIYFENTQDSQNFKTKVYSAFDKVLLDISQNGIKKAATKDKKLHVEEVTCVLSSPWYKSKLKNFFINENKEVNFTKDYLDKLLEKEENLQKIPKDYSILEKKIISVYMNGYETEDPFNKKSKTIQLSFYVSYIDSKIKKDFETKISEKLHFNKPKFNTHPFVSISVIKNTFHHSTNFLLVDVGGEVTDIGLFRNGVLQSLVSVPSGTHLFVRELVSKCSYDKNIAFSNLNMLSTGKLDKECTVEVMKMLEETKGRWLNKVSEAISTEWQKEKIPPIIFITVDNEAKELIQNIFTDKSAYKILKINRQPIVHIINSDSVKDLIEYEKGVNKDSLLSIISEFIILEND